MGGNSPALAGLLDAGDDFGAAMAGLGDLDGNGTPELAIGAPGDDDGHPQAGAVWILFTESDGSVGSVAKLSASAGGFPGALGNNYRFGDSVTALGDVDGDGIPDLAVGVPRDKTAGPKHGAVWVVLLNSDGSTKSAVHITEGHGGFFGQLDDADEFGRAVAALGDLDGDGTPDLAVGALSDDDGASQSGAVWILFLNPDGSVREHGKISNTSGMGGALQHNARFGRSVTALGDLDGNGVPDLAVGASNDHDDDDDDLPPPPGGPGPDPSSVWVLLLDSSGHVLGKQEISASSGGLVGPLDEHDGFGSALASAGDVDGDGLVDLLVGAPGDDDGGPDRGALWLLSLTPGGSVASERKYSSTTEAFLADLSDGEGFGSALAGGSDLDANGALDLLAGSPLGGGFWLMLFSSEEGQAPYVPSAAVFEGKPGRATLVLPDPDASGFQDFIDEPVVVVTDRTGNGMSASFGTTTPTGDVNFTKFGGYNTSEAPSDSDSGNFTSGFQGLPALQDVVVSNFGSHSFSFFRGLAAGLFAEQVEFSMLPENGSPVAIVAAHLDGDGFLDVVLAGGAGVTSFLGDGTGNFPVRHFTPASLLTDLDVADVDGDGVLDVVATSGKVVTPGDPGEAGFATVLRGLGDGSFTPVGAFATGTALASVLLDDLDQDGAVDALIVAHAFASGPQGEPQGFINLYTGNGNGLFVPSAVFAGYVSTSAQGTHPLFGDLGDINGDGFPDAVYSSNDNISHPESDFADEQPPVTLTVLTSNGLGGFVVTEVGTAYAGKGVAPLMADIFPDPQGNDDAILVWYGDTQAGQGGGTTDGLTTYLTAFTSDGVNGFFDPSANQFPTGDEPGDGALDDVNTASSNTDAADVDAGRLDVVVPNLKHNTLTVLLGDGDGGVRQGLTFTNLAPITVADLPSGQWVGGPRSARVAQLDGQGQPDAVVYSAFTDLSPVGASPEVYASLSVLHAGFLTPIQYLPLPRGGDFALGDVTGDGVADAVVTQRLGPGGPDVVHVYRTRPDGKLVANPLVFPVPAGATLSGGLTLLDLTGDGRLDLLTTLFDADANAGRLLAIDAFTGQSAVAPLPGPWATARSVVSGDVDGDGKPDALVGLTNGRLHVARGLGGLSFSALPIDPQSASVGGGALAVGDVNGDGRLDVVSSTAVSPVQLDQAFVRVLLGKAGGGFKLTNVDALQSTGILGSLTPLLGDMNIDGALDLVLVHGTTDRVSILVNQLAKFQTYGAGKKGSGGVTPFLSGQGFTSLGGNLTLKLSAALANTPGLLRLGLGQVTSGFLHVQTPLLDVPFVSVGTSGVLASGGASFPLQIPDQANLVGLEVTTQALLLDAGAGAPAPFKLAASNGLALTIVP